MDTRVPGLYRDPYRDQTPNSMRAASLALAILQAVDHTSAFYLRWYHECEVGLETHAPGPGHTSMTHILNWIGDAAENNVAATVLDKAEGCQVGITAWFRNTVLDPTGFYFLGITESCAQDAMTIFRFSDACVLHDQHHAYMPQ